MHISADCKACEEAIALGGLTALQKLNEEGMAEGVRGICTGDQFRRLVSRTLAQTFTEDFRWHDEKEHEILYLHPKFHALTPWHSPTMKFTM